MKAMRLALMALLVSGLTVAEEKGAAHEPKTDEEFIKHAIVCDTVEIKMSELAQKMASSPAVQRFAQKMIADHTSNRTALLAIARDMKVETPEQIPADKKEEVERLSKADKSGFDRDYIKCQVEAHEKALKVYEKFSKEAKNEQVRAAAAKATPIIRMHHEEAKRLQTQVGQGNDKSNEKGIDRSNDKGIERSPDKDLKDKDLKDKGKDKDLKDKDSKDKDKGKDKDIKDKDRKDKDR